ncbi:MAG: class I SAM-dependent methyltransferase [Rhodoferax sp.]|uniref:class I SAM-dependent methyltransferase n=1 Tax=Rhodoferax sp. TaxID=50421 RepID=UPI001B59E0F2|nr:class I SAM-dependent methyltransferase [Rhodoferax sp.]MBP8285364.1 class I SAM-dependent methyltransferase [Rhodoferax sp.]MBP9147928.1 class I SAM-dependent methyltransferase [Rhodoferax sp.]MBP9735011.1 class I SAM-dependent methyltransferase [Rhodoferax sp.]
MKCRHCGSELHLNFLDLGSAPPSNAYLSHEALSAPETWYPLRLLVCETCWLVQTEDHAGREQLFTHEYAYFSSMSTSWLTHAQQYVSDMVQRLGLGPSSTVVEVAANDGYLLQYVAQSGIPCYGIEPTASTAAAAKVKGLDILESFFGEKLATQLATKGRQADLMVANNVLAHVPDINDFVAGFATLLKPQGVATFEFPHLMRMMEHNQFDTAYHEHYSYLSLTAVRRIFVANGLTVFDVQELPTHGGSLRVLAQRSDSGARTIQGSVAAILSAETQAGLARPDVYKEFQSKAESVKNGLLAFLLEAKQKGLRVGAYGAAAKGNTLLNFAGVRPDLLPYVVDRSPGKQGKFMPGSRIPIVQEDYLWTDRPDLVVVLPWNLLDEVSTQLQGIRAWGGRFVVSVPELRILESASS